MAAMRRRLLPVLALCRAAPVPRPHCRFLHSPSLLDAVAASASSSPNLLSRSSGSLPQAKSVGEVVADAPRGAWVHWRSSPQGPDGVVLVLVGANVAVYALCRLADPTIMMNHFVTSLDNFKSGRLHTLLTSAFSHRDANHLLNNMTGLYFFSSSISVMFGPAFLLKMYLTGALTGSAAFLAEMTFLAPRKQGRGGWKTPMLGASGAVNAITLLVIFLYPRELLDLHFFFPVPAAFVGARMIGTDLWRMKKGPACLHTGGLLTIVSV
ncbi:RHOMBOID-like protein 12, mitochondrial [Lolium perenne]|uniref:RHOMBOID-like protein 12, mitochondrial n=1 Tax=Lolium perenne TaxID=4522 RepID=UPI0021F6972B|nr:RHOMBOID-like protein 12, mitochondrial [Lolium perenne]